jgi:hypothetical protein
MRTAFVDMLLELNFEKYSPFVLNEGRNKVFFLVMLKSLNGMLQSEFYFYTKFKKEIVQISSFVNLYDRMVNKQNGKWLSAFNNVARRCTRYTKTWFDKICYKDARRFSCKNARSNKMPVEWEGNKTVKKLSKVGMFFCKRRRQDIHLDIAY